MILRGIMDYSLSGILCIRGFAPLRDLAAVSKADADYQRDLMRKHKETIKKFLMGNYVFFPEVILSFSEMGSPETIRSIFEGVSYGTPITVDGSVLIRSRTLSYKISNPEEKPDVRIATVSLPDDVKYFNRIDGNHRLSAAEAFPKDRVLLSLETPFCLLLLPKESAKFEKTVFHNINFKHIPLTKEEHLEVILDGDTFSDVELKSQFGPEYLRARQFRKEYPAYDTLPNLGNILKNRKREVLTESFKLFSEKKILRKVTNAKLWKAFSHVESIYDSNKELSQNSNYGLLIALLYVDLAINRKSLDAFVTWVVDNCIYQIKESEAMSVVDIYESFQKKRFRQIFLSMEFKKDQSKVHCRAIKGVVDKINRKYGLKIPLRPIKMNMFKAGYSYKITDEILEQIDNCGLLIADLSFENINVYHEVGYLMGQNKKVNRRNDNFILLMKQKENDAKTNKAVGFNLADYNQIRFKDTEDLRIKLEKSIIQYYDLDASSDS